MFVRSCEGHCSKTVIRHTVISVISVLASSCQRRKKMLPALKKYAKSLVLPTFFCTFAKQKKTKQ